MNEREHYAIQELYEENVFVTHGLCLASMHKMPNLHFHDGFEIFLSMSDGCVFSFEEKSYRLDRGGLILANNRELHRTFAPPEGMYERYIVSFIPDFISDLGMDEEVFHSFINRPADRPRCIQLTEEQVQELVSVIERLQQFLREKRYGEIMLRKLALAQIVILCSGYFEGETENTWQMEASRRLQPVFAFIKEHIEETILLDDLADFLFISKAQLIRLFKEEIGMTPNEYIILSRIMRSREYLARGYSVIKVCEMVGYADESHFIRTFKKIMGITPKQYGKLRRR